MAIVGQWGVENLLVLVMLRFWFFHLDSISIRFFTENSMSIRFWFPSFRQEISYTSPINLGTAMLNYSGEAVHMCNSAGTPCMGMDQLSDALTEHVVWEVKPGTQLYISCESNKTVPGHETPDGRQRRPGLTVIIVPPTHVRPQLTVVSLASLAYIA